MPGVIAADSPVTRVIGAWVAVIAVRVVWSPDADAIRTVITDGANIVIVARIAVIRRSDAPACLGIARVVGTRIAIVTTLLIPRNARATGITSADATCAIVRAKSERRQNLSGAGRRFDEFAGLELAELPDAPVGTGRRNRCAGTVSITLPVARRIRRSRTAGGTGRSIHHDAALTDAMPCTGLIADAIGVATNDAVEIRQPGGFDRAARHLARGVEGANALALEERTDWTVRIARKTDRKGIASSSDGLRRRLHRFRLSRPRFPRRASRCD
jgi:hypothetical protein